MGPGSVITRRHLTGASVALAVASMGSAARADAPDLLGLVGDDERAVVHERLRLGVATAPFEARSLSEAKGHALSFVTDGWLRLTDRGWIGLRIPVVAGSVAQPAGSLIDEAAWGNPQLRAATRIVLAERDDLSLRLTLGGGIGVPAAEHASTLLPNRALAIANALEGLSEPELFRPGRLPLTPFGEIDGASGRLRVLGVVKLPVLVRVSEADLPKNDPGSRAVGVAVVLQLEGRLSITRAFGVALSPLLFVDAVPPARSVVDPPRAQLSLSAGAFWQVARWGSVGIDVRAPVGGALGGSTVSGGLRFSIGF